MNHKADSINDRLNQLEYINKDLVMKLKIKEEEVEELKKNHEFELQTKNEIYNNNYIHLNKTHQEDIKKVRLDYEHKTENLIKKIEDVGFYFLKPGK